MRQNSDKLEREIGLHQAVCQKQWSTFQNFETMYSLIYPQLIESGVAKKCPAVWMDEKGNVVEEGAAFGKKVEEELVHPDYLLFVDEVGNNTNMKEDGRVGGEKKIGVKGEQAQTTIATNDAHYTMLGFTAATGEPVMCAVIFKAKEVTTTMQLGIDITKEKTGEWKDNVGVGKRYPGAPTCQFHGKDVPAFVCCSEGGGINSELLTAMLQQMDGLQLFPRRQNGPKPFLILDGHTSRFQIHFLKYVNNPNTKWFVCIGILNGTLTGKWEIQTNRMAAGRYQQQKQRIN